MGGELFFGMRDEKGREKLQLRWTNQIPLIMAHPSFISGGKVWKQIWDQGKPNGKWPGTRTVKTVTSSEYGVVLVDLKNQYILSRQDYCTPNMLHVQGIVDWEYAEVCLFQHQLNRVEKLTVFNRKTKGSPYVKATKAQAKQFWDLLSEGVKKKAWVKLEGYYQIQWSPPKGFTFDFTSTRARDCWPEVVSFLKKKGWKAKTRNGR